jgi:hypothetical protein
MFIKRQNDIPKIKVAAVKMDANPNSTAERLARAEVFGCTSGSSRCPLGRVTGAFQYGLYLYDSGNIIIIATSEDTINSFAQYGTFTGRLSSRGWVIISASAGVL